MPGNSPPDHRQWGSRSVFMGEGGVVDRYRGFRELAAGSASALSRTAFLLTGDVRLAEALLRTALARTAIHWEQVEQSEDPEAYVRRLVYAVFLSRRRPVAEGGREGMG